MRVIIPVLVAFSIQIVAHALETTSQRRIHYHHRRPSKEKAPVQSLSELLAKSEDLTKKFQAQAQSLRERVQESETIDAVSDEAASSDIPASFLELDLSKPLPAGSGLRAMEAVTEEIMQYTDKMRKLGNEASLFSRR
jgi:hypothetical protein